MDIGMIACQSTVIKRSASRLRGPSRRELSSWRIQSSTSGSLHLAYICRRKLFCLQSCLRGIGSSGGEWRAWGVDRISTADYLACRGIHTTESEHFLRLRRPSTIRRTWFWCRVANSERRTASPVVSLYRLHKSTNRFSPSRRDLKCRRSTMGWRVTESLPKQNLITIIKSTLNTWTGFLT